jgi:quinone-modifying oxidoreductase subunit QmoC
MPESEKSHIDESLVITGKITAPDLSKPELPAVTRIDPDLTFVQTVAEWGGGDLKTCFQCATCAVVCPLSPDVNPFPRKEVLWAQWGLKDRLAADPDLWLCHRCNDCSEHCPRGAKTGDVMAALRSYAYREHAWPGFLGRAMNRPTLLPLVFALPLFVVWAIIRLGGRFTIPVGEMEGLHSTFWGRMIEPWPWLDLTFIVAALFVAGSFYVSLSKLWRGFMGSGIQPDLTPKMPALEALQRAVTDILLHRRFAECGAAHARRNAHLLIFLGFAGLFATTGFVFIGMYLFGLHTPLPLDHWIKILGNASAITIAVGLVLVIARRLDSSQAVTAGRNSYQDVLFLTVLTLTVVTGILSEVFRLATLDGSAYATYFLHLTFIFFLIFYAPYSKFAHVLYHATTLTWAHHVGRVLKQLPAEAKLAAGAAKIEGKKSAA